MTLTPDEEAVLCEMNDYLGHSFTFLAGMTGVHVKRVREIVRGFHAKGLADYGHLVTEDDGMLAGRGYWLSREGAKLRDEISKRKMRTCPIVAQMRAENPA